MLNAFSLSSEQLKHKTRIIRDKYWKGACKTVILGDIVVNIEKLKRKCTLLELINELS